MDTIVVPTGSRYAWKGDQGVQFSWRSVSISRLEFVMFFSELRFLRDAVASRPVFHWLALGNGTNPEGHYGNAVGRREVGSDQVGGNRINY